MENLMTYLIFIAIGLVLYYSDWKPSGDMSLSIEELETQSDICLFLYHMFVIFSVLALVAGDVLFFLVLFAIAIFYSILSSVNRGALIRKTEVEQGKNLKILKNS